MFPTPAVMARGVAITAIIAGVGACQSSTIARGPANVLPSLVLAPVEVAEAASASGRPPVVTPWEQWRNDAGLGAGGSQPIRSDAVVVQTSAVRLRTTNGRPREHSVWTTRSLRVTSTP